MARDKLRPLSGWSYAGRSPRLALSLIGGPPPSHSWVNQPELLHPFVGVIESASTPPEPTSLEHDDEQPAVAYLPRATLAVASPPLPGRALVVDDGRLLRIPLQPRPPPHPT